MLDSCLEPETVTNALQQDIESTQLGSEISVVITSARNIALLGGSGFLGNAIKSQALTLNLSLASISRRQYPRLPNEYYNAPVSPERRDDVKYYALLNCAASWRSGDLSEIREANFDYPLRVAESLSDSLDTWIQVNSYYNYRFEQTGLDRDAYSEARRRATSQLSRTLRPAVSILDCRLPHLIGPLPPKQSFVGQLFDSARTQIALPTGSGNQILPVLDVRDAAKQLLKLVGESDYISQPRPTNPVIVALHPSAQVSLRELTAIALSVDSSIPAPTFGAIPDRDTDDYAEVDFWGDIHCLPPGRPIEESLAAAWHSWNCE